MTQQISIDMTVVSSNNNIEKKIRSILTIENITINIKTCELSKANFADVLIYDASSVDGELPKQTDCLECVLCAPTDQLSPILIENSSWTAFWPMPLPDPLLKINLEQIILNVKSKKEYEKTKIFLNTLIDSVPDLIWFKDLKGSHLKVNEAFGRAVGKTKSQCEGRGHYYIWDLEPDEYAKGEYVCLETEEEVIRQKKTCLFDEKVKSKNGLRQFKTYKSPLFDQFGEMFGTVGIAKDVTDLQNIGRELEVILSSIPFAAMIINIDNTIVSVNPKFCEYFNVSADKVLEMPYGEICKKILNTTQENLKHVNMTEVIHNRDGNQYVFHAQQQFIHDIFGNDFGIFFICIDLTKEYELQQKILHSANTDFLTELYNRRYFYHAIGQKSDSEQLSFIYFDLDDFKEVNDTYGHQCGDDALILMAKLLQEAFPEKLIARLGGDEFVVAIFDRCIPEELAQMVGMFIKKTSDIFKSTPNMEKLTVSAGIACNGSSKDVDALLSCADKALYAAKALGKARYTVFEK